MLHATIKNWYIIVVTLMMAVFIKISSINKF